MQLSKNLFSKLEFLVKFQTMYNQIFKKSTIKSVFKIIQLLSYNLEVLFQKICAFLRFI